MHALLSNHQDDDETPNYRGVSFDPQTKLWRARIYCLGRHVTLGRYQAASEAAFAHDRAAYFLHAEEARTNFGIDRARQSIQREAPSSSWRVMATLQSLAEARKRHKLAAAAGGLPRPAPWPPARELVMRRAVTDHGAPYSQGLPFSDIVRLYDELDMPADDLARLVAEDAAASQLAAASKLQSGRLRAHKQVTTARALITIASRVV